MLACCHDALHQVGRSFWRFGNVAEAELERALLVVKIRVPESRRVHNNTVVGLPSVAEAMLIGELE